MRVSVDLFGNVVRDAAAADECAVRPLGWAVFETLFSPIAASLQQCPADDSMGPFSFVSAPVGCAIFILLNRQCIRSRCGVILVMLFRKPALNRFAFILGNGNYRHVAKLNNPHNDIARIEAELTALGYTVFAFRDLDCRNTWFRLEQFVAAARDCDAVVMYYSGHGLQLYGDNYIIPVDFDPATPVQHDVDTNLMSGLIRLQDVMQALPKAKVPAATAAGASVVDDEPQGPARLIFLDACRDEGGLSRVRVQTTSSSAPAQAPPVAAASTPSVSTRGTPSAGLARQSLKDRPKTFICFAADPGDVAQDGDEGGMSPFTQSVTSHISARGLGVFDLSQRISREVRLKTGGQQVPWMNSSLPDEFSFHPADNRPMWIMAALGALAGCLAFLSSTNVLPLLGINFLSTPLPLDHNGSLELARVTDAPANLLTSLFFGSVLGFGAYVWAKRSWIVAVLTCLTYFAITAGARYWFGMFADATPVTPGSGFKDMLANLTPSLIFQRSSDAACACQIRELLFTVIVSTGLMGAASVLAAAPWNRDLRRPQRISMGVLIGAGAAVLMILFVVGRAKINEWLGTSSGTGEYYWMEVVGVFILFIVWHALLAINVGRAYAKPTYD
jgi:uncharacterized caspase-like protein